jgi:glycerol-3-phosphate acyltransferase PlsX
MRIAIDVMGGDFGPEVIIPSALRCAADHSDLFLVLVGDKPQLDQCLKHHSYDPSRILIQHADQVVAMDDRPSVALRHKKGSSMHLALGLVQTGEAQACVSCGNTGALMAIGRYLIRTVQGIDRPAIIKAIPTIKGHCYLLDLGANINCEAENLIQFAAMGSLMCEAVEKKNRPTVGLLNIGHEESKGGDQVKLAAELLKSNEMLNFVGFVEGDAIYQGDADVVVCDGWVGNVALKTSEGLARFASHLIEDAFNKSLLTRAAGLVASPVLNGLKKHLEPQQYNGAGLLGLNSVVVKSHGQADDEGFYHALTEAMHMVDQDVPGLIGSRIESIMEGYS